MYSSSNTLLGDVLYVASTFVQNGGPFRDDVPAVASLSLDQNRLFDVSAQGVGTGTEIKLERKFRGPYKWVFLIFNVYCSQINVLWSVYCISELSMLVGSRVVNLLTL